MKEKEYPFTKKERKRLKQEELKEGRRERRGTS